MSSPEALLWSAGILAAFDPEREGASSPVPGAGSDRRLTRLHLSGSTLILVENPSPAGTDPNENDSFIYLSEHLGRQGLPVPKVIAYDRGKGFYLMEDLGERDLFDEVSLRKNGEGIVPLYEKAVDLLIRLQTAGVEGFDPRLCHSPARYDRRLMIDWESGYFQREFVEGYLGLPPPGQEAVEEYRELADRGAEAGADYFLHRDFQSRNLKLHKGGIWIIDFQGARLGPPQYDLAALLFDPYAELAGPLRSTLLKRYTEEFCRRTGCEGRELLDHFYPIAVHRLMQALGAYAFLGNSRNKPDFLRFIPAAVRLLGEVYSCLPGGEFPALGKVIAAAGTTIGSGGTP